MEHVFVEPPVIDSDSGEVATEVEGGDVDGDGVVRLAFEGHGAENLSLAGDKGPRPYGVGHGERDEAAGADRVGTGLRAMGGIDDLEACAVYGGEVRAGDQHELAVLQQVGVAEDPGPHFSSVLVNGGKHAG